MKKSILICAAFVVLFVGSYFWLRKYGVINNRLTNYKPGAWFNVTNIVVVTTNVVWVYQTNWAELPDIYFHMYDFHVISNGVPIVLRIPVLEENHSSK